MVQQSTAASRLLLQNCSNPFLKDQCADKTSRRRLLSTDDTPADLIEKAMLVLLAGCGHFDHTCCFTDSLLSK